MFRKILTGTVIVLALMAGGALVWFGAASLPAHAAEEVFFGGDDDVAFAERLWRELAGARLVGPNAVIQEMSVNGRRRSHIWRNYPHGY